MRRCFALLAVLAVQQTLADVYLHNPRGSNDRNCRNDNNDRRRNGNRLFDSQNNDKGGYSCPRAYPFPQASTNTGVATVNEYGDIISSTTNDHIDTDTFFYYAGTEVMVEWTSQHSCGANENTDCRVILQYMCDTGAPTGSDAFLTSMLTNQYIRDGTPIKNNDNADNTNDEATTTIPANVNDATCNHNNNPPNCAKDGRYGFQETHPYYSYCNNRQRNYGLFTADQLPISKNQGRNRAINTRQNPDGTRHGLECPEERDYYPYWHPAPFKDVAVGVPEEQLDTCKEYVKESQNVIDKCYCDVTGITNPATPYPNNPTDCALLTGAVWKCGGKWGLDAPECFSMPYTRDNHLGNTGTGYAVQYNWTLPEPPEGQDSMRCFLRVRYNITTADFPQTANFLNNCDPNDNSCTRSPIADRDNREALTYLYYFDTSDERLKLSMAVNTNQHARTFQDRTYAFDIKRVPSDVSDMCGKKIVNINVRGKRGNIVQVYPAVEYDFVPQDVLIEQKDCVHLQWIGSDYNPDRNPNNAEGGPYNPNNVNEAKADRSNLIQLPTTGHSYGFNFTKTVDNPFFTDSGEVDMAAVKKFAFLDQNVADCDSLSVLRTRNPNNRQARERDPRNCAKLNSAKTPYFKGGVYKANERGTFKFISTRNNNFSNRSQKLKIDVGKCTYKCGGNTLSDGQIAGVTIGVLAGACVLGFASFKFLQKKNMIKKIKMPQMPQMKSKPQV